MNRILLGLGAGLFFALAALPQSAQSAIIPGLFNTGLGGIGVADPNYTLDVGTAIGIVRHPAWAIAPVGSDWIGLTNGSVTDPAGPYLFTTTFDLTGLNPATASVGGRVAVDNSAVFKLNGVDVGVTPVGFASLVGFTISSEFIAGLNTLEIFVTNFTGSSGNPMGLLITDLSGDAEVSVVPLPAALPLFGTGLVVLGFAGWRRKRRAVGGGVN